MSASPQPLAFEKPDLASLVSQSRNALQQGEALCHRANDLENASAQTALDVLALNAKIKWISDAVLEQLKLAAGVAKSIEEKRSKFEKEMQSWDTRRTERSNFLDTILDTLGSQHVPPDFHETASDSSLFGSQSSGSEEERPHELPETASPGHSPSLTIRYPHVNGSNGRLGSKKIKLKGSVGSNAKGKRKEDRSKWKTLRDFVDERTIDEALENIDAERTALDDAFDATADYPVTLQDSLDAIRGSLPPAPTVKAEDVLRRQGNIAKDMAGLLHSLTEHLDKMEDAANEGEQDFTEDDYQEMARDGDELPVILSELEDSLGSIENSYEQLVAAKSLAEQQVAALHLTADDLDQLGDIMTDMLRTQQEVEDDCTTRLHALNEHLVEIGSLCTTYTTYQMSFNKLLLEVARRRQYKEAAEHIVRGMMEQLHAMTEEEQQVREDFNHQYGDHLPEDICLYLNNPPTRWDVVPLNGDETEVLPEVDDDLIVQAREAIVRAETDLHGSQSL